MKIIVSLFLFALVGCNTASQPVNVAQLKQEILNSACDEDLRIFLENRINKLERTLNERQLIKNLQDIKSDLKC